LIQLGNKVLQYWKEEYEAEFCYMHLYFVCVCVVGGGGVVLFCDLGSKLPSFGPWPVYVGVMVDRVAL
jgi:hypothetical protein